MHDILADPIPVSDVPVPKVLVFCARRARGHEQHPSFSPVGGGEVGQYNGQQRVCTIASGWEPSSGAEGRAAQLKLTSPILCVLSLYPSPPLLPPSPPSSLALRRLALALAFGLGLALWERVPV